MKTSAMSAPATNQPRRRSKAIDSGDSGILSPRSHSWNQRRPEVPPKDAAAAEMKNSAGPRGLKRLEAQ